MPKKFWTIYPRTKEAQIQGLSTEKGVVNFRGKTSINTSDEGLVKSIQEQHKADAYAVHDEQLSKAYDSESWDVVQDSKGIRVKNLHNYTFSVRPVKKLSRLENFKRWLVQHRLVNFLWFWDLEKERGVRVFGREFVWRK